MIWNLDTSWLMMAVAIVSMLSFFLGMALDGVMGEDGFGAFWNTVIITCGFFLGIVLANMYGIYLKDLKLAMITGLCGAFLSLGTLAVSKSVLARL